MSENENNGNLTLPPLDSTGDEWYGPPLPHNIEAERSVLGAAILDAECRAKMIAALDIADFFHPPHKDIWQAILDLGKAGALDAISVTDRLKSNGLLIRIGGAGYITGLMNVVPTPENALHHAHIVKVKARCREMAKEATLKYQAAMRGEAEVYLEISQTDDIDSDIKGRRDRIARGDVQGVSSGFSRIDSDILLGEGLPFGYCSLVVAEPKVGKTAFVLQMLDQIARPLHGDGTPVLLESLEMRKQDVWPRVIYSRAYRRDIIDGYANYSDARRHGDWAERNPELAEMESDTRNWFIDDRHSMTAEDILAQIRWHAEHKRVKVAAIDHLGMVTLREDSPGCRNAFINDCRALAKELNIHIIWVAHRSTEASRSGGPFNPMQIDYYTFAPKVCAVQFILRRKVDPDHGTFLPECVCAVPLNRFGAVGKVTFRFIGGVQTFDEVKG